MGWHDLGDIESLSEEETTDLTVAGVDVLVCNDEGELHVVRNRCSHQLKPLTGGMVDEGNVICPLHGAAFCLKTGEAKSRPAVHPIEVFASEIRGDRLFADLPEA